MNTAVPSRNPASLPIPEFGSSSDGLIPTALRLDRFP